MAGKEKSKKHTKEVCFYDECSAAAQSFLDKFDVVFEDAEPVLAKSSSSDIEPFDHNTVHYRNIRRRQSAILSMLMGFIMFQNDPMAMDMAMFWNQIILDHFDEWYVTKYPDKVIWK